MPQPGNPATEKTVTAYGRVYILYILFLGLLAAVARKVLSSRGIF